MVLSSWCLAGSCKRGGCDWAQRPHHLHPGPLLTRHETPRVYLLLPPECACLPACLLALLLPGAASLLCSAQPAFLTTAAVCLRSPCLCRIPRAASAAAPPVQRPSRRFRGRASLRLVCDVPLLRGTLPSAQIFPEDIFTTAPAPRLAVARLQFSLPLLVCHLLKRPAVSRPAPKDPVRCFPWRAIALPGLQSSSSRHAKVKSTVIVLIHSPRGALSTLLT